MTEKFFSPLRRDALRVTEEGKPSLILQTLLASLSVTALVLEGTSLRFETIREMSLRHPMTVPSFEPRKVLRVFLDLALQQGYLCQPRQELMNPRGEGPFRCHFDQIELSLEKGSLGCRRCEAYVCLCGRCLCGYATENNSGQEIYHPPPAVSREERLEYIRVVKFCLAHIETRPKAKILMFPYGKNRRVR